MRLDVGNTYEVVNSQVPQGTPGNPPRLTISEMTEHEGAYIVVGQVNTFQTHPYIHGFVTIPAKSAVFVVLPIEYRVIVEELVKLLRGLPLALRHLILPGRPQPIVNWAERMGSLWYTPPGEIASIEEKRRRARLVIDLWHEIRRTESIPPWFLRGKNDQVKVRV